MMHLMRLLRSAFIACISFARWLRKSALCIVWDHDRSPPEWLKYSDSDELLICPRCGAYYMNWLSERKYG